MSRYIDADAYIKYCDEHWLALNVDAVNAQPAVDIPRWIPVTEGLPEIGDRALVTIPSIGETFVTIGTYAGEYRWHISDYGFCEKVIAWMPLPEPYKGGEEE